MQREADDAFKKVAASGSEEFEQGMKEGGRKAARTLSRALQQEYRVRMARARLDLAEGTIDEKAFEREGREAAQAFNRGLTGGIRRLRGQGNVDALTLAGLTTGFKRTPGAATAGVFGGMAMRGLAGPLAGVLTAGAALSEARDMVGAADELNASILRLEGTSKLAGLSLTGLQEAAAANREEFKLGTPVANDLTGLMTRLAAGAGDVGRTTPALRAWLDLAASRGMTAAEAMQALEVTLRGQDEGLNRLGLANPQQIYDKWGAGADEASKLTAILNEVQAEGAKVNGTWAEAADTAAGKADQAAQRIRDLQAEAGTALQPLREMANALKINLYEALVAVIGKITETLDKFRQLREERWERLPDWMKARRGGGGGMSAEDLAALDAAIAGPPAPSAPPPAPPPAVDQEALKKAQKEAEKRRERIRLMWLRIGTATPIEMGGMPTAEQLQSERRARFGDLGGTLDPAKGGMADIQRRALEGAVDDMEGQFQRIQAISQEAAYQMASAFQDAFQLMRDEGATIGNFFEGIGRGIAGSMLAGIAQMAQGKAAENIAAALEAAAYALGFTSHGNFASASAAWASAAQHGVAATAWAALAGGAGMGRGAVTGGAGAIPGSTRDAGLSTAEAARQDPAPIILELNVFDPSNPVIAKSVGQALALDVRLTGTPAWAGGI